MHKDNKLHNAVCMTNIRLATIIFGMLQESTLPRLWAQ